jgi:hypothetical protein
VISNFFLTKNRAKEIVLKEMRVLASGHVGVESWELIRGVHLEHESFEQIGLVSSQGQLKRKLARKVFKDVLDQIWTKLK